MDELEEVRSSHLQRRLELKPRRQRQFCQKSIRASIEVDGRKLESQQFTLPTHFYTKRGSPIVAVKLGICARTAGTLRQELAWVLAAFLPFHI